MKVSILLWLGVITQVFAGVWIPSSGVVSPEGKIVFNLPFPDPREMQTSLIREGFYSIPSGNQFNFKRVLAILGSPMGIQLQEFSSDFFLPSENPSGYLVLEDSKKVLKINLDGATRNDPGFFTQRFTPNLKGVEELPEIDEIPSKIGDFGKWHPGDSVSFGKVSDLLVNAAFGARTFLNYGVVGRISGYWDLLIRIPTNLENPEKKLLVLVTYSVPEGFNFNFDKGEFPQNVDLFKLWGKSQKFTFLFDLSNTQTAPPYEVIRFESGKKKQEIVENANVLLAYQEALKGNLIMANLLSQMKNYGVRQIFEEEEEIKDQAFKEGFKIRSEVDPNFKKGSPFIVGVTKTFQGEMVLENMTVQYNQDIKNIRSDSKIRTFVGFIQQIENFGKNRGASKRRFGSVFKSHIVLNNVNRGQYLQALKSSLFRIGFLEDSLIPSLPLDKTGNLDLDLDINLSNLALEVLMDLPREHPENLFVSQANEYVSEFFKNETSANHELCENYGQSDLNKCIFISKKRTFEAITNGYRALKVMKMKKNDRDYFEFLKSFGEFGKAFIENRFTIVTFLKFIRFNYRPSYQGLEKFGEKRSILVGGKPTSAPFEIRMHIRGANLKPFSKVLRNTFRDVDK